LDKDFYFEQLAWFLVTQILEFWAYSKTTSTPL